MNLGECLGFYFASFLSQQNYQTMKKIITVVAIALSISTANAQNIVASNVSFEIGNMGFKTVEGTFSDIQGEIAFDESNLSQASFDVCIPVKTVNTENEKRDQHLLEEDFFHEAKYPTICFTAKGVNKTKKGYVVEGTLKMRGVSKSVSIPFTFANNTFNGSLELERLDYQLGPNGGFMIGKTVVLQISCQVA